ncbi:vanadium-dependent haloperoxidase [Geothrix sp. 21YS21S-2]|uniref:vanadium-dependent haloperoxidase n=1 Tax=Geothrix sp. 21YS21S-2 TaxID=3068893 RepID=UPI0027B94540|nr:vanadium-dependent haloperoxidase [Geothrix sp. 21YS21S-2]
MRTALLTLLVLGSPAMRADEVTEANARTCAILAARTPPGPSRRVLAITQVAVHEAVNAATGTYKDTRLRLAPSPGASPAAAVAAATRGTLLALVPLEKPAIEAWYAEALARVPGGTARTEGIALGERAAAGVLALKADDGASVPETYRPRTAPGVYVPTVTPAFSQWPGRKPWHLEAAAQFRPGPPPALASATWARDLNESRTLGGRASRERTPEQTAIGKFWEDNTPGIYFGVLRSVAEAPGRELAANARWFAFAATALDDATIAVFDAKYAYLFWRPLTAIRNADQDGNEATERDPGWAPLIDTPMHPEYPCAHCINAAAFAEVLEAGLSGSGVVKLSATSLTAPGVVRSWSSTSAMVEEVANARVWSGVHFRNSTQVGEAMGHKVGRLVAAAMVAGAR